MALWRDCGVGCEDEHEGEGVIQRYVHLTRELEAPASYHVFSLLATVSAATGRRIVLNRGAYRLWPNLYVLLHGPSGIGKSVAAFNSVDLLRRAVGEGFRVYPEDLTGEGLSRIMYSQTEKGEPCVGFVFADEFGDLLGGQQYKEEFAKRLTRLYACPAEFGIGRAMGEVGERWVKNVFLAILGCSQEDWLRTLPIHALKGGLFARIIVVPETSARHRRYEPKMEVDLAMDLASEIAGRLEEIPAGVTVVGQDAAAREMGEEWYMGEDKRRAELHPIVMPWCERRLDHAIKLAYLRSLLEGGGAMAIDEESMRWGIEVVEWLTPRIETAFMSMNESQHGELHRIIMDTVSRAGGRVAEKMIRQGLGYKYRKTTMDEGIMHLITAGQVRRMTEADPMGGVASWLEEVKGG